VNEANQTRSSGSFARQGHTQPFRQECQDWILSMSDVVQITGMSRATIYALMSRGTFPQAAKVGVRRIGWKTSQIKGWMDQRFGTTSSGAGD